MPYSYRSSRTSNTKRKFNKPSNNRTGKWNDSRQLDAKLFIASAKGSEVEAFAPQHTFTDFALNPVLQANLVAHGYQAPTQIQDQAIEVIMSGSDVLGMAGTGTGKTAAFALPVLHRLLKDQQSFALIVAPTRELAQQIQADCRIFAKTSGLRDALLIGGSGMGLQLRDLRSNPRIVIGTPGRIKDHMQRGTLKLNKFNIVVLDEVDRMLDMGFVNDVRSIINDTADKRQSLFFSATLNPQVRTLVEGFANEPVVISIKTAKASENVEQDVIKYQTSGNKLELLHDLLINKEATKVIIFDETQRSVERLANDLLARGFAVDSMHGGKSQGQRQRALAKFKTNQTSVLVATDVAARGLDVSDISHVVNYSIPHSYDDYIHRIGRAGRAGKQGFAFTFLPF